jgi:hypothetical protein
MQRLQWCLERVIWEDQKEGARLYGQTGTYSCPEIVARAAGASFKDVRG